MESDSVGFTGVVGFMIHGTNWQFIVPLIGLLLLLVSFFAKVPRASRVLDLLSYGSPAAVEFDPAAASRRFEYAMGRRPGFLDGVPGV